MDNKEIKALLKQARDAIKEKEFRTALKHCKAVLKVDKNNYNAWVFVGVATQETNQLEQSVFALKKAIEISPTGILAWQGLCSLYEKNSKVEYQEDLLNAYEKLFELLNSEKEKQLEILKKWTHLVKSVGSIEKLMEIFQLQLKLSAGDSTTELKIWKSIFDELKNEKFLSPSLDKLRERAFKEIMHSVTFSEVECQDILTSYIKPLYESGHCERAVQLTEDLINIFPDHIPSVEFLIKANLDAYIKTGEISPTSKSILLNWKKQLPSGLESIFQGVILLISGNFIEAMKDLTEGLEKSPSNLQAWCIMAEVQLKLHRYADSEKSAQSGLQLALQFNASHHIIGLFYLCLGRALAGRRNWHSAIEAVQKSVEYIGRTLETLSIFCRILLSIDQIANAEKICNEMSLKFQHSSQVFELQGLKHLKQKQYNDALQNFQQAIAFEESSFTIHLVAVTLWEMQQHEKAFKLFLKAAKLDPYFSENFLYLGKYFMDHKQDFRKALECFQESFKLDRNNEEVAKFLSLALKKSGKNEDYLEFLKILSKETSLRSCKWVWVELGLNQLEDNACADAVLSLQKAVRLGPKDSYMWECLGDAYLQRGSHESALRSYERASELSPTAVYPLYQISTILKMCGSYSSAIEKYKNVLKLQDTYVPALIGLAEALLNLAEESLKGCIFGQVQHCCQETLQVLSKVINTTAGLSSLWKLAGDACTLPFHLSEKWFPIVVPSALTLDSCGKDFICMKSELLSFGAKFYGTGLSLHRNLSSLWHDLGVNIHLQSLICDSKQNTENLADKSLSCLQKAVSVNPTHHAHWNALGVVASSKGICDLELAQHAFVKSILVEGNNSEAWTNIGVLYLSCENVELAHQAFSTAQSLEPSYPLCWLGQAVIASSVKHSETVDLFRHAATLGPHSESLLGYGRMVCNSLLDVSVKNTALYKYNIEEMDAVVVATDCLIKYTGNNENSSEAFNMLGLLLERQGIFKASLNAYKRSIELLQSHESKDDFEKICMNYARILSCTGEHEKAVKHYMLLKKKDASFICSFGFALQRKQQYREALTLFNQALQFCQDPEEKSQILVAMAMVALDIKEKDVPNSLNLLLESSQIKPPSVHGLLALCAMGILKGESNCAAAALKELQPYKYSSLYCTSVAFMRASYCYFQNNKKSALREMLKILHFQPNNSTLWIELASCLLQWESKNALVSGFCSKVSLFHNGNKEYCSQVLALCHLANGCPQIALTSAQKAVHLHPDKVNNWITLTAACHVATKMRKHVGWIIRFAKGLAMKQGISPDVFNWLVIMDVFHCICSKDFVSANHLCAKVFSASGNLKKQSILKIIVAVLKVLSGDENLDILVMALKDCPNVFLGWEVLIQLLMQSNRFSDVEKVLGEFAAASKIYFPDWVSFPAVQLAVLSYNSFCNSNADKEYWISSGKKYAGEAVKMSPNCLAARFIQGLIALKTKNTDLSRRSFKCMTSLYNANAQSWMEKLSRNLLVSISNQKNCKEP